MTTDPAQKTWYERAVETGYPAFPVKITPKKNGEAGFDKVPLVFGWQKALMPNQWPDGAWAQANGFGVNMGPRSGLYALDADDWKPGCAAGQWMRDRKVPITAEKDTISGGRHLVYTTPKGYENLPTRQRIVDGLDSRGMGGYIVWEGAYGDSEYSSLRGEIAELPVEICDEILAGYSAQSGNYNPIWPPAMPLDEAEKERLRELVRETPGLAEALRHDSGDRSGDLLAWAGACYRASVSESDYAAVVAMADWSGMHDHVFGGTHEPERALGRAWAKAAEDEGRLSIDNFGTEDLGDEAVSPTAREEAENAELEDLFGEEEVGRFKRQRAMDQFGFVDAGDLIAMGPALDTPWLLKGLIPPEGIGVVYGAPGSGKTFLMLDMCARIVLGKPWNGCIVKVLDRPILYVMSEGGKDQARNRLVAWSWHNGGEVPWGLQVYPGSIKLGVEGNKDEKAKLIRFVRAIGGASMIVFDTLARNMTGDENTARDMGAMLDDVDEIRRACGGFGMLVHHSGKDPTKGSRGHSSLLAAVDVELELVRDRGDPTAVGVVTATKVRDGQDGRSWGYQLVELSLGVDSDLGTVPGVAVSPCPVQKPVAKMGAMAQALADTYEDLVGEGQWCGIKELAEETARRHNEVEHFEGLNREYPPSQWKRAIKKQLIKEHGWETDDLERTRNRAPF